MGTERKQGVIRLLVVDDLESANIVEIARGVGIPAPGYELVVVKDCWKDAEDALQHAGISRSSISSCGAGR